VRHRRRRTTAAIAIATAITTVTDISRTAL
jgi:hypothetical protein